jgi:hypothetical protein
MDANWIWIVAMSLALAPWVVILAKKRWGGMAGPIDNLSRFDKQLHDLDSANLDYFNSLDLMLQNLLSMRSRADRATGKFWEQVAQPGVETATPYELAAQLVSLGKKPSQVAALLDLPVSQVKLLQDSQDHAPKERQSPRPKAAAKKSVAPIRAERSEGRKMSAVERAPKAAPKPASQPAPQNSAMENDNNDALVSDNKSPRVNGIAHEMMRTAGLVNGARKKLPQFTDLADIWRRTAGLANGARKKLSL